MSTNTIQVQSSPVQSITLGQGKGEYTLAVTSADWNKYIRLKAEKSAIEKSLKALEQSFAFPAPEDIAGGFKLTSDDSISIVIVNGNADIVGKVAIYWHSGSVIPAGWRKRIS
jgi:hypothetical protein